MARLLAAFAASTFAVICSAQDLPVPKMFKDMHGGKGQYKVEILEEGRSAQGEKKRRPPSMTLCTDNLMNSAADRAKARAEAGCQQRLLKDTVDEAVMESVCKERRSTITLRRDGKSMLMDIASSGPRGERSMKMRFTHLGACRDEQGAR
jgi:hypothetical protein